MPGVTCSTLTTGDLGRALLGVGVLCVMPCSKEDGPCMAEPGKCLYLRGMRAADRWLVPALGGVVALGIGATIAFLGHDNTTSFVVCVTAVVVTAALAVWDEIRRTGDVLSPLTLSAIFYVLAF